MTKSEREDVSGLLASQGLIFEDGADHTALLSDTEGRLAATASLFKNVIRMVAVNPEHQESGLSAVVISSLMETARVRGISHLLVYTKSDMAGRFASLGFRNIAETESVALLEVGEPGIGMYRKYLADNKVKTADGALCGAVVINCNPFTLGHRYLIERACGACDVLYAIVVETDLSDFSFEDRLAMVRLGTEDLNNVRVLRSGPYAVSSATFPTYFLKDRGVSSVAYQQTRLDVDLFARLFVPSLALRARFIGTERDCGVTGIYNEAMKELLPPKGVEVVEIERAVTPSGQVISASTVRGMLAAADTAAIADFLPSTTMAYLTEKLGYAL